MMPMNYGGFTPANMVQNPNTDFNPNANPNSNPMPNTMPPPTGLRPGGYSSPRKLSKVQPENVESEKEEENCQVESSDPRYFPNELKSFAQGNFPESFIQIFKEANYNKPTPIQKYGIPVGMDGKDIIGIAKTGSGKTLAFILPALLSILREKQYYMKRDNEYDNKKTP